MSLVNIIILCTVVYVGFRGTVVSYGADNIHGHAEVTVRMLLHNVARSVDHRTVLGSGDGALRDSFID